MSQPAERSEDTPVRTVGNLRSEAEPNLSVPQQLQLPPKLYDVLRAALAWHRWQSAAPTQLNMHKAWEAQNELHRAVRAYIKPAPGSKVPNYSRLATDVRPQTPPSCKRG